MNDLALKILLKVAFPSSTSWNTFQKVSIKSSRKYSSLPPFLSRTDFIFYRWLNEQLDSRLLIVFGSHTLPFSYNVRVLFNYGYLIWLSHMLPWTALDINNMNVLFHIILWTPTKNLKTWSFEPCRLIF